MSSILIEKSFLALKGLFMIETYHMQLAPIVDRALKEEWGGGDWTTDLCVPKDKTLHAKVISNYEGIVAGLGVAAHVFQSVSRELNISSALTDGCHCRKSMDLLEVYGEARAILKAEKVAMNLLSRMCAIATKTRAYVEILDHYKAQLIDSRDSTPGLKVIEKAAIAIGGAKSRRLCLRKGVLVNENHIRASGSITIAVNSLLESLPPTLKVEVVARDLPEVHEALSVGADLIILENMSLSEMRLAVRTVRGRVLLEATGDILVEDIELIAKTGVDFISTRSILNASPLADVNLRFIN